MLDAVVSFNLGIYESILSFDTISPSEFLVKLSSFDIFLSLKIVINEFLNLLITVVPSLKEVFICCPHSATLRLLNPNLLVIPSKSVSYVLIIVLLL